MKTTLVEREELTPGKIKFQPNRSLFGKNGWFFLGGDLSIFIQCQHKIVLPTPALVLFSLNVWTGAVAGNFLKVAESGIYPIQFIPFGDLWFVHSATSRICSGSSLYPPHVWSAQASLHVHFIRTGCFFSLVLGQIHGFWPMRSVTLLT